MGDGAVSLITGTAGVAAGSGEVESEGGVVAFLRRLARGVALAGGLFTRLLRGDGTGLDGDDAVSSIVRRRLLLRSVGVSSSVAGLLPLRVERRTLRRGGEGERASDTLMSEPPSLSEMLVMERERGLRRRELAAERTESADPSTSMSDTSVSDSAARSSRRSSRACMSTARRRPYGEMADEMPPPWLSHSALWPLRSDADADVASGTAIALRNWRVDAPTKLVGRREEVAWREASRASRMRSASFLGAGFGTGVSATLTNPRPGT